MEFDDYSDRYDGGLYVKTGDVKKDRAAFMRNLKRRGVPKNYKKIIYDIDQNRKDVKSSSLDELLNNKKYKSKEFPKGWYEIPPLPERKKRTKKTTTKKATTKKTTTKKTTKKATTKKPTTKKTTKKTTTKKTPAKESTKVVKRIPARLSRFIKLMGVEKYNKQDVINAWNAAIKK